MESMSYALIRSRAARTLTSLHKNVFSADDAMPDFHTDLWWLLISNAEGGAAGFCGMSVLPRDPGTGYLKRAGVLPKHRGQGLQRRMVRVRETAARRLGLNDMITTTYHNSASANNLISCGYKLYDPRDPWMAKGTLYWVKHL